MQDKLVATKDFLQSIFKTFLLKWRLTYLQNGNGCFRKLFITWDALDMIDWILIFSTIIKKQPPSVVPRKRRYENMQQIYRRTPMPKCNFKITLRHGCSPVNLLLIFRTPFLKNTTGCLLLILDLNIIPSKQAFSNIVFNFETPRCFPMFSISFTNELATRSKVIISFVGREIVMKIMRSIKIYLDALTREIIYFQ